jgi:uncharacterized membrane protein
MPDNARYSLWGGVLTGAGIMAAVDEIVFHQVLGWHHFYDLSTPMIGLLSDGFLHAAELVAIVAGFFMLLEARKRKIFYRDWALTGGFLGAGCFQLFDGIVDHKVLRLHQIRYEVDLLPYDIAWNISAVLLIVIGIAFWRKARPVSD